MRVKIKTEPSIEPVTLGEVCKHLRLDSSSVADNITELNSIFPGSHAVTEGYTLKGTAINVAGYGSLVIFNSGTNLTGGTVDVKIQESDTASDSDFSDWAGGSFTQVTTANDNAIFEKEYTGIKPYIRAIASIQTAECSFSVDVVKLGNTREETDLLNSMIKSTRIKVENFLGRALINQTLYGYPMEWPDDSKLVMPRPPLQSVTSIKYFDVDDVEYTISGGDYYVDVEDDPGAIILKDGITWPYTVLREYKPIVIEFVAGYGAITSSVDERARNFLLVNIGNQYRNRDKNVDLICVSLINDLIIWKF